MTPTKSLRLDAFVWLLIMVMAAVIAFNLMQRDKQRRFGAVSFGAFPSFDLPTVGSGRINDHILKGKVWAVHAGSSTPFLLAVSRRLAEIEQRTASGKRHLYILTFADSASGLAPQSPSHFIALQPPVASPPMGRPGENTVFLLDQDGIIRGKYAIDDLDGYKKFQQDLLAVL